MNEHLARLEGAELMAELGLREVLAVAIVRARAKAVGEAAHWKRRASELEAERVSRASELPAVQRDAFCGVQTGAALSNEDQSSCYTANSGSPALLPVWEALAAEEEALLAAGYSALAAAAVRDARLAACASRAAGGLGAAGSCSEASTVSSLAAVVRFTLRTVLRLPHGSMQAGLLAAALEFLLHALQPGAQPADQAEAAVCELVPGLLCAACSSGAAPASARDACQADACEAGRCTPGSQASCCCSPAPATPHPAAQMLECLLQVPHFFAVPLVLPAESI